MATASERWIYLGKETDSYRRTRARLGAESEWIYDQKLRETAEKIRQPFLDFVARIGAEQTDPVTWWSTRFSWKLWTASDLFLLTCYLAVAESCITQARQQGFPLRAVVEDPWLLRQIRENTASHANVSLEGPSLLGFRFRQTALGLTRRGRWFFAMVRNRLRQKRLWPAGALPVPQGPAAGIFSYPSQSAFEQPGAWRDSHLPELDRLLSESGSKVIRFTPPECGGWEKELAERSSYAYPLILWATGDRLLRSLGAFWRPRWPEPLHLEGRSIRWLCLREGWLEVGRASLCAYRLFYECLKGMLSQGNWQSLITFYENQPWEKLQVLAARARGVKTLGLQTTTFSRYHLSYALGKGEQERMPLPDRIGSSGAGAHRLLLECGAPAATLKRFGALRYGDLLQRGGPNGANGSGRVGRAQVLVVLSIDPVLSRHLLEALGDSFPDGGAGEGLEFTIRPHPMCPIPQHWVRFPSAQVPSGFGDFRECLTGSSAVLFTASTVGFEAMAEGKPALRYRSPRLFDVDELYGPHLPIVSDSNLREDLLRQVRGEISPEPREETRRWISDFFAPVDRAGMEELLRW